MIINDRVYGTFEITDPCALELIASPAFDRLWRVNQNGAQVLINPNWNTSRAEHCIGAYHLLCLFGASREEQLAGLLHDTNHLAFSHVIDYVFNDSQNQEAHHAVFPDNPHLKELQSILNKHGFDGSAIMDYDRYTLLEQPSKMLCADRIDYSFRDGITTAQSNQDEIQSNFLNHLIVKNDTFCFDDLEIASQFARISIATDVVRASHKGIALFWMLASTIRLALEKGIIAKEDLLGTDDVILEKLRASSEPPLKEFFSWLASGAPIELGSSENFHFSSLEKFRWVDPDVLHGELVIRASTQDEGLRLFSESMEYLMRAERYIRIPTNKETPTIETLWTTSPS